MSLVDFRIGTESDWEGWGIETAGTGREFEDWEWDKCGTDWRGEESCYGERIGEGLKIGESEVISEIGIGRETWKSNDEEICLRKEPAGDVWGKLIAKGNTCSWKTASLERKMDCVCRL